MPEPDAIYRWEIQNERAERERSRACAFCGELHGSDDPLCDSCKAEGIITCDACAAAFDIDSESALAYPVGSSDDPLAEFEFYCEGCSRDFEPALILSGMHGTIARSMLSARGKALPDRILLWCKANEPDHLAEIIAGKLCATFADCALGYLSGYELKVWEAVTIGGWKK